MAEKRGPRFIEVKLTRGDVRRIYARLSRFYDAWGFLLESKAAGRALELACIRDGESVLEVAVGTGVVFERILRLNPQGRNEGIDLSSEMLGRCRKRLSRRFSNYSLQVADAHSLPYPDETFDLIVNNYMFDLLPEADFGPVLAELRRVIKHGGRLVITSMAPGRVWYARLWGRLLRRAPKLLAGCRPVSLEEDIRRGGFGNIHAEYISQLTFPSEVICARKV